MKKILLSVSILAFSFASAQQKNLFDIQKHIQGKIKENKLRSLAPKQSFLYPQSNHSQSYTLPNGNKVYTLAQDNMPCVKPDMSQFNMPNVADGHFKIFVQKRNTPGKIPNPISPFEIIPSK